MAGSGLEVPVIAQIDIWAGEYVNGISLHPYPLSLNPNDAMLFGNAQTGPFVQSIRLNVEQGEMLTGIQGMCGDYVDSIRFKTNMRTIPDPSIGEPPFGGSGGSRPYEYILDSGHIVGFFGNIGAWINSIGIQTWEIPPNLVGGTWQYNGDNNEGPPPNVTFVVYISQDGIGTVRTSMLQPPQPCASVNSEAYQNVIATQAGVNFTGQRNECGMQPAGTQVWVTYTDMQLVNTNLLFEGRQYYVRTG